MWKSVKHHKIDAMSVTVKENLIKYKRNRIYWKFSSCNENQNGKIGNGKFTVPSEKVEISENQWKLVGLLLFIVEWNQAKNFLFRFKWVIASLNNSFFLLKIFLTSGKSQREFSLSEKSINIEIVTFLFQLINYSYDSPKKTLTFPFSFIFH